MSLKIISCNLFSRFNQNPHQNVKIFIPLFLKCSFVNKISGRSGAVGMKYAKEMNAEQTFLLEQSLISESMSCQFPCIMKLFSLLTNPNSRACIFQRQFLSQLQKGFLPMSARGIPYYLGTLVPSSSRKLEGLHLMT